TGGASSLPGAVLVAAAGRLGHVRTPVAGRAARPDRGRGTVVPGAGRSRRRHHRLPAHSAVGGCRRGDRAVRAGGGATPPDALPGLRLCPADTGLSAGT